MTELVHRYQKRLDGFIRTFLPRHETPEDLRQAVLAKMARSLDSLRDSHQFESWLFMMARHACLDALRSQKRRPAVHLEREAWDALVDDVDKHAGFVVVERVRCALECLSPEEHAFMQWVVEGHRQTEIARRLGITRLAVKARLSRLRTRLRAQLARAECVAASVSEWTETSRPTRLRSLLHCPQRTASRTIPGVSSSGRGMGSATPGL